MVRETRHLWVANLPDNTREDRIREHFQRWVEISVIRDGERQSYTRLATTEKELSWQSKQKSFIFIIFRWKGLLKIHTRNRKQIRSEFCFSSLASIEFFQNFSRCISKHFPRLVNPGLVNLWEWDGEGADNPRFSPFRLPLCIKQTTFCAFPIVVWTRLRFILSWKYFRGPSRRFSSSSASRVRKAMMKSFEL